MNFFYFYQLIYAAVVLAALLPLAVLIVSNKNFRAGLHQRLGLYTKNEKNLLKSVRGCAWVHASSVGEIKLVSKIPVFRNRKALITTSSPAGKEVAKKLFPRAAVFLMPLDLMVLWKRLLKLAGPEKLFVAETELWPGLIFSAQMPKALFNGRMSDEKYKIYLKLGKLMKILLNEFDCIFARDKKNYSRFIKTGAEKNKLKLLGNLKFLQKRLAIDRRAGKFKKTRHPVIAAGCTHPGEETIIVRVVEKLREDFPEIALILSPRHIKRVSEVEKIFKKAALEYGVWSTKGGPIRRGENIIVDSMGELSMIYSIADIVFVGGSFDSTGGHNVIEPAVWGRPVVIGPYYSNFTEEVKFFKSRGGLKVALRADNLYNILLNWLKDAQTRNRDGDKNRLAAKEKRKQTQLSLSRLSSFAQAGKVS